MDIGSEIGLFYIGFPAVDVTHTAKTGGVSTPGRAIFDQPGLSILSGELIATDYTLRYPATSFPSVRKGDTFTIASITYTAREHAQPTLDGLEQLCPLSKP